LLVEFTIVGWPLLIALGSFLGPAAIVPFTLIAFAVIYNVSKRDERLLLEAGYVPVPRLAWVVPAVYLTLRWMRTRSGALPTMIAVAIVAFPFVMLMLYGR